MNKEKLFDFKLKRETVEAFGQSFIIQEMDGVTFERFVNVHDNKELKSSRYAVIVLFSVVNDKGELVFTESELPKIERLPFRGLQKLVSVAIKLSDLFGSEKN